MSEKKAFLLKGIVLGCVGLGAVYAALLVVSSRSLNRVYADLEKDGRPMRPEDLIPAEIPESQNAAILLKAAVLGLQAVPAGEDNLFSRLDDLSDDAISETPTEDLGELSCLMKEPAVIDAIAKVSEAVERPGCNFDLDYSKGAEMLLPHLAELRSLSRILAGRSVIQSVDGDVQGAWQTAIVMLKLADILKKEPVLISQLVRAAQLRISCEAIRSLCHAMPPSEADRATISELLKRFDDTQPWVLAIDSDRVFLGEWAFAQRQLTLSGNQTEAMFALASAVKPWSRMDHAVYLRVLRDLAGDMVSPYSAKDNNEKRDFVGVPKVCILTHILVPALGRVKVVFTRMQASSRLTLVGLEVLDFRQRVGTYPQSLSDLGAEIPKDPFTQGDFRYRLEPDGFLLYSDGPDLKDDGGEGKLTLTQDEKDILWRYSS